jgi:hypothetical protein
VQVPRLSLAAPPIGERDASRTALALARLRVDLGARIRPADALASPTPVLPSGTPALDDALGGGLPRGRLIEAVGPGRTSLAMHAAQAATRRGELCAWVEAAHAFDARSAVRAGIDCTRLLVAQADGLRNALRAADVVLDGGGFGLVVVDCVGVRGRIPPSAWARLAHRAEQSGACVLTLGERAESGTFAHLALRLARRTAPIGPSLLGRIVACAEIIRAKRRAECGQAVSIVVEPPDLIGRSGAERPAPMPAPVRRSRSRGGRGRGR